MNDERSDAKIGAWLRRAAVHYLGQRSSSVENLRQVLARKAGRRAHDLDDDRLNGFIDEAVAFCQSNGFVDDTSYAETKVTSSGRKGMSRRRIGMMLEAKGVADEVIGQALEEFDDTLSAVRFAKKRRLGPWRTGEADPSKEVGSMARAGFRTSLAFRIARMTLDEAESILYGEIEPA